MVKASFQQYLGYSGTPSENGYNWLPVDPIRDFCFPQYTIETIMKVIQIAKSDPRTKDSLLNCNDYM